MEGALFVDDTEGFEDDDEGGDRERGHAGDGKAEEAMEFLSGLLYRMGLTTRVTVREDAARVVLDVSGNDAGRAIGKKGQTLDALQFLVNKVVNRFPERRRYVIVDSGDYRERHDQGLVSLAKREAKRAIDTGRVVTLEPMPARDRRVIHLSLAKFPGVSTKSNGEGIGRRIQIIPVRSRDGGPPRADGRGERGGGRGRGRGGDRRDRGPQGDRPRDAGPRDADRPREGGLREVERPREGGLREVERPREGSLREVDRPREGGLREVERPRDTDRRDPEPHDD